MDGWLDYNTDGTGTLAITNVSGSDAQTNKSIQIIDIAGTSNAIFTPLTNFVFYGAVPFGNYLSHQVYE